uniref:Perforin-1-like n=1 Tax=Cyprinus carpio TaxID=7962 RepID=A0A8C1Y0Y0_CYPCA
MGLFQIYLIFLALLLISGEDDLGASKECKDAPFVPGYNLAGEGFDVVTMERKGSYVINTEIWDLGNGTCRLHKNKYMNGIQQKLPAAVVHWRTLPKCSMKVSSQIFESSEALVNDSSSALSVSWKVGIDVKAVGAAVGSTHSREAKFAMTKSKNDKYSFTKHEVGCNFYSYRVIEKPPLHEEFLEAIKSLPASYDPDAYHNLISTYGLYGDQYTQTDGTVTVTYGTQIKRTETIDDDDNPRWPEIFEFGPIKIKMANKLTFDVYDADSYWNSDPLGTCSFDLRSGVVSDACVFTYGTFFFTYEVKCAPSLQGPQCNEHKPSPMAAHLADIFSSRNGVLVKDLPRLELALNNSDKFNFKSTYGKLMMLGPAS